MTTCILVPYDGSPASQRAIPCAVGLARATHARIVLVRATPDDLDALLVAELDTQALAIRIRREGVPVTIRVRAGAPVDVMEQETRTWGPDWIVLSSHGDSGAGRWLFGSVADQLLRTASAPVLLVPANQHRAWPQGRRPRLLVPLDGSAEAEHALPVLRRLAAALEAHVVLLRVVEPPIPAPYAYDQCAPYVEFEPHVELGAARAYLHDIADGMRLRPGEVECHATIGQPGVSLPLFARDHHADFVILTRTGAGKTTATLGGAALGTLQMAGVPLVLVPVPAPVPAAVVDESPLSHADPRPAAADTARSKGLHAGQNRVTNPAVGA